MASAACGPAEPASDGDGVAVGPLLAGQDCVVIVLDALAADQLGCYGAPLPTSPRIDALAAEGVRFAHAWSPSSWTLASTASLFTGLLQESHGVTMPERALPQGVGTLAGAFAAAGYVTAGFVQNPYAGRAHRLEQGFDRFEEAAFTDPDAILVDAARALLAAPSDRPRFVYLHLRRPHAPYDPAPEHLQPFEKGGYHGFVTGSVEDIQQHNAQERLLGRADLARLLELYRGNLHQADASVGRLLDGLDRERTLVLLLSDHGEAFGRHERLGHNWGATEEFLHVPLIASHPALAGGTVVEAPVSTLDLVPTLLELFGLPPLGHALAGTSVAAALLDRPAPSGRTLYASSRLGAELGSFQTVRDERHKLVRKLPDHLDMLYDLEHDEYELAELSRMRPDETAALREALAGWRRRAAEAALPDESAPPVDEDTLRQLRALGYAGEDG